MNYMIIAERMDEVMPIDNVELPKEDILALLQGWVLVVNRKNNIVNSFDPECAWSDVKELMGVYENE